MMMYEYNIITRPFSANIYTYYIQPFCVSTYIREYRVVETISSLIGDATATYTDSNNIYNIHLIIIIS